MLILLPKSKSHDFHARVIPTAKERFSDSIEGHNIGTDKLLSKHCGLTEICGVSNLFLLTEDSELAIGVQLKCGCFGWGVFTVE